MGDSTYMSNTPTAVNDADDPLQMNMRMADEARANEAKLENKDLSIEHKFEVKEEQLEQLEAQQQQQEELMAAEDAAADITAVEIQTYVEETQDEKEDEHDVREAVEEKAKDEVAEVVKGALSEDGGKPSSGAVKSKLEEFEKELKEDKEALEKKKAAEAPEDPAVKAESGMTLKPKGA